MKQFIVLFSLLLLSGILLAQKAPIKWGKISEEDLAMTTYEADPDADAVVLYDYGNISFDLFPSGAVYNLSRTKRIKILKNSAFDRGNIEISYFKDSKVKITLKAHVFQPDGSETQVAKQDIYDEKIYQSWYQKRVALPDVTEGCIIEYTYKITSPYLSQLRTWYFQEDIPIRTSELRLNIPEWFEYARLFQGVDLLTVSETNPGIVNIDGRRVDAAISRYVAENVAALKEEPYITTMDDYRMRIKFQLSGTRFPGRPFDPFMTTWEGLAEGLIDSDYFGKQFTKKKRVQPIQAAIEHQLNALDTKLEKIKYIHQYVANNVEWDGDYDATINEDINKAFELKRGNSAEINLMVLALLRANDIEAYPILVSTRGHGKAIELYPFRSQFNHVLVYTKAEDEKPILLDVADSVSPINLPRIASLNKRGLLIWGKERTEWINIESKRSKNVLMANLTLDEEGILKGDIQCQHTGYSAVRERGRYSEDISGSYWVDRLEEQAVIAEIDKFDYSNLAEIEKPFKGTISCTFPEQAQVVNDFIYLSPVFYSGFQENPFKIEKRTYPVDIPYPFSEQVIINIDLPEDYAVEEFPSSIKVEMPNGGGKFTYHVSNKEAGKLQIVARASINQLLYMPEEYEAIKNFYDVVAEKLQEQIVLKRIE